MRLKVMKSGASSSPQTPTQMPLSFLSTIACEAPHHLRIALGVTSRLKTVSGSAAKVSSWMCLRVSMTSLAFRAFVGIVDSAQLAFDRRFNAGEERAVRLQAINDPLRKVVLRIFKNSFFVLMLHELE